jgi:hypothetical protein
MAQSLPAKVEHDLAERLDFVALSEKIYSLNEKLSSLTLKDEIRTIRGRRDELYFKRSQLMSNKLIKW